MWKMQYILPSPTSCPAKVYTFSYIILLWEWDHPKWEKSCLRKIAQLHYLRGYFFYLFYYLFFLRVLSAECCVSLFGQNFFCLRHQNIRSVFFFLPPFKILFSPVSFMCYLLRIFSLFLLGFLNINFFFLISNASLFLIEWLPLESFFGFFYLLLL